MTNDIKKRTVFIVDDHPVIRRGLSQFINSHERYDICGAAEDANTAIAAFNDIEPEIAIVDINLKGINGLELIKAIRKRYPQITILVLSMYEETEYVERAIKAGAMGYVLKSDNEENVIEAMDSIHEGKVYLSDSLRDKMLETILWHSTEERDRSLKRLTDRELEIFSLIGKGYNTRQIAQNLNISSSTVGTYRERIKKKLKIYSPNELIKYAVQWSMSSNNE